MKVRVTVNFSQVEFETEVDDNMSKEDLEQELSNKVFIDKADELIEGTVIDYYDYIVLKEDKQC